MNDARLKLGLVAAFLFVTGSALLWNGLYRSATEGSRRFADSDRLVLLVNGGDAPARPLAASSPRRNANRIRSGAGRSAPPPPSRTVSVEKGDSLIEIADAALGNGNRWREIAHLNDIEPPYLIRPGQVLRLPAPSQ